MDEQAEQTHYPSDFQSAHKRRLATPARSKNHPCGRAHGHCGSRRQDDAVSSAGPRRPSKVMMGHFTSSKPLVFISYSHNDRKWVDRLLIHLKPLGRGISFDVWDDSRIKPGSKWHCDIDIALRSAAVAILLVSANFLASDFVMDEEVPVLIQNAETHGTIVIPVLVTPSLFHHSALRDFESINSLEVPLSSLSAHKRDEVFVKLAVTIAAAMSERNSPTSRPGYESA